MTNLFENAARNKYRFQFRGVLTTEDLWDLKVEQLDSIYKELNKKVKDVSEESLLNIKSSVDKETEDKIEIIKHIVAVKVAEADLKSQERNKREQKQKILEIIESKQNEELQNKSLEELKNMVDGI